MTNRELKRIVTHWRGKLGMDHWTLEVKFATQDELGATDSEICYGRIWPDLDSLTAQVFIIREQDIDEDVLEALTLCHDSTKAVIEQTVIHELLHARMDPCSQMRGDSNFESGLNHAARALWEGMGLTR